MFNQKSMTNEEKDASWIRIQGRVRSLVESKFGTATAVVFMDYYKRRFDSQRASLLHWPLCFHLMSERRYCRKIGTRWYACVGAGGTGKSTFMANVFYFVDETFKINESNMDIKKFIRSLENKDNFGRGKALFMDEPDDEIHPQTETGKRFRKVLGKARQGKFFFGICATDLTDIPPYIFRKIDVLFFTPQLGKYIMFRDDPYRRKYVMPMIRKAYMDGKGYQTLLELAKTSATCEGWTTQRLPFSRGEVAEYLKKKKDDFHGDIAELNNLLSVKEEKDNDTITISDEDRAWFEKVQPMRLREPQINWNKICKDLDMINPKVCSAKFIRLSRLIQKEKSPLPLGGGAVGNLSSVVVEASPEKINEKKGDETHV